MAAVSVIIPFYNREASILDSVQSVLAQTYSSFELLLIDDGSTDNGYAIASAISDPRVRVRRHATNLGAAAARNTGIRESRYPLLAFLDSDDLWWPEKLEKHLSFHLSSGAAATCTSFRLIRENGACFIRNLDEAANWYEEFLYGCHVSPGSTMMVSRDVFERVGFVDESLRRLEDWDWLLRLVNSNNDTNNFAVLDSVLSDVQISGYPSYESVVLAIKKIDKKFCSSDFKDEKSYAVFKSGLQIEIAYTSFHNSLYCRMIVHLVTALVSSPYAFFNSAKRIIRGRI